MTSLKRLPITTRRASGRVPFGSSSLTFLVTPVNVPIGVERDSPYEEVTVAIPANATLVAFTDGLVERRGETIDVGLERLRRTAAAQRLPLEDLVAKLPAELAPDDHSDDTAIVGVQWQN
ncbi:MAG: SpoIIE family protein phosphatase [Solirubrobacterales bacterium]|nr:SpoIIE family protein phosphatase [Solirubrobacterales bacterium]